MNEQDTKNYAIIDGNYVRFDLQSDTRDISTFTDVDLWEYLGYGYQYYRHGNYVGITKHIFRNKGEELEIIENQLYEIKILKDRVSELEEKVAYLEKIIG